MASLRHRLSSIAQANAFSALLLALGGLTLSGFVLSGGLVWGSMTLNELELANEKKVVENVVTYLYASLAQNARDYARSDDAVDHLEMLDKPWLDQAIGSFMWSTWNYDYVFATRGDGSTVWGFVDGAPSDASARSVFGAELSLLIDPPQAVMGGLAPAGTVVAADGKPVVAAVAAFRRRSGEDVQAAAGVSWRLILGQRLDGELAGHLGKELSIAAPAFRLGTDAQAVASVDLQGMEGRAIGALSWQPRRPGRDFLVRLGPTMVVALGVLLASIVVAAGLVACASRRARASEQRFRDFADIEADWLWETDASDRLTYVSDRHGELLGAPAKERIGMLCWELGLNGDGGATGGWHEFRTTVECREVIRNLRTTSLDVQGRLLHLRISGRPVHDDAGRFLGYRGTGSNITDEAEAQSRAHFLAHHDALTKLPNRLLLRERLEQDLARAERSHEVLAVLFLDLDHFKKVNDLHGHSAGDALLQSVAARLEEELRGQDTAARLGGDEFVVVLPNIGSAEQAVGVADRLVERLAEPYRGKAFEALAGTSIGIALFPSDAVDAEDLLRFADIALYRAKTAGRGQACLFAPEMDQRLQARRELELALRDALASSEQLLLHYQPQFNIRTRRLIGFEALVRWSHPQLGLLSPDMFIALAEETGLIVPLGNWVLRRACEDAKRWPAHLTVAVNLSPVQFRHGGLVEAIRQVIAETSIVPARLQLEVTENILVKDTETVLAILDDVQEIGVRVVMDDFGSGYPSLAYLRRFTFDEIKIDRRFTQELGERADARAVVDAALALGRNLDVMATAEGVENAGQLDRLKIMGCEQIQGFYCGRPIPAGSVEAALGDEAVGLALDGWIKMTASQASERRGVASEA